MTITDGDDRSLVRVVLADANVLYSRVLRDYLLYAASQAVLVIRWSAAILAEMVEHLAENVPSFDVASGARLIAAMNVAFPAAEVEPVVDAMKVVAELNMPDEDDRHVLAAAISVGADVLCTDNLKDFPVETMGEVGIQLMSADALLSRLVADFPSEMVAAHRLAVTGLPGATDDSTLGALRRAGATGAADRMAECLAF